MIMFSVFVIRIESILCNDAQELEAMEAQAELEARMREAEEKEYEARQLQEELEEARRKMEENQRALEEALSAPAKVIYIKENSTNDENEGDDRNKEESEFTAAQLLRV